MCVTTNNAKLFFVPSRLKSHIILVLDRLQCVARVNCPVNILIATYVPFCGYRAIVLCVIKHP